jgi:cysteinyl-tRNA synthetase
MSKVHLYNTLTREKEEFVPIDAKEVRMYSCGPTVYDHAHIGNLRAYIFADTLERVLKYSGYAVKRVMNITDIGHLSSDADSGDDKMTKGLLREGKELNLKNMRELAEFYTGKFKEDLTKLNVKVPAELYFASDYVNEDVELIQKLEEKSFAYKTSDGIYFDTAKMPDYGVLWGGKRNIDESQTRVGENSEKRDPKDFALWKFNSSIGFPSPWGQGFPGWHIECSAMGIKFLGEQFDIHTGGIDLIPTHHTNEIAQSESATGKKPFVRFWMHSDHIDISGEKMAKSTGNFFTLQSISEKQINPIAYKFWILMGHYRTKLNFNWQALEGAETALKRLQGLYLALGDEMGSVSEIYRDKFTEYVNDDLNTPQALTLLWDVLKDETLSNADKKATILDFDKVLGLGFAELKEDVAPEEVLQLVKERELAKQNKDWTKADEIRGATASMGYKIDDTPTGPKVSKI